MWKRFSLKYHKCVDILYKLISFNLFVFISLYTVSYRQTYIILALPGLFPNVLVASCFYFPMEMQRGSIEWISLSCLTDTRISFRLNVPANTTVSSLFFSTFLWGASGIIFVASILLCLPYVNSRIRRHYVNTTKSRERNAT